MRRRSFLSVLLGLAILPVDSDAANSSNLAVFKPFVGLCYSPFAGDQSPNYGTYPTVEQIAYDLTNEIQYLASEIRTFGMDGTMSNIPGLCSQFGIPCYPCAYLAPNNSADNQYELDALIAVGNANYPTTRGLVVGTEAMQNGYDPNLLASNIAYVRAGTGGRVPVGTSDVQAYLVNSPNVVSACDFVMVNIYAYWAEMPLSNAVAWTLQQWQEFTNFYPGKRSMIGEVNWPTGGGNVYWSSTKVVTSVANQGIFLSQFAAAARENHIEYFIFDYRDELWKIQDGHGDVEQHWGLFYTNNVKKQSLADYQTGNFALRIQSTDPGTLTLAVPTYEGGPYSIYTNNNIANPFHPGAITNFFGAPGTNVTIITLPQTGPSMFYGAGQNF